MIRKTKTARKRAKKSPAKMVSTIDENAEKSRCNHCGGLLRLLPYDASCINCGREADHHCANCLFDRRDVVA